MVEISRPTEERSEEEKQSQASSTVALFFGAKYLGILITSYLGGYLLEFIDKREGKKKF